MFNKELFDRLLIIDKEIVIYTHISAVLEFDLETAGSPLSGEERAVQLALIAKKIHSLETSEEMAQLLNKLGSSVTNKEGLGRDDFEKALIRKRFNVYILNHKIPNEFIGRKEKALSLSYNKWVKARGAEDFSLFSPSLKEVVSLMREEASYIKEVGCSSYDALLNQYEEGMNVEKLDRIFNELQPKLVEMIKKYSKSDIRDEFLYKKYDREKQENFAIGILSDMGFDMQRGTLKLSEHPFTSTLGSDDIRITTRYTDPSFIDPLSSTIHEGFHALYEMGASDGIIKGTSLGEGVSMGFHESQSRFGENVLLRSKVFWDNYYCELQQTFPENLGDVSEIEFVRAINKVQSTFIRTNADEVTYNLHIILRYRLEKKLIEGEMEVEDIPKEWNKMFYEMFNLKVDKLSNGCLQDVHWASGLFGYFPTYALGNLYSGQIYNKMLEDFGGVNNYNKSLAEKGLLPITDYLKKNIHKFGGVYEPAVLLNNITGENLNSSYFISYLSNKLDELNKG